MILTLLFIVVFSIPKKESEIDRLVRITRNVKFK